MKDEKTQDYLAHHNILWQFNLSMAPWWGGQFERLVGVVKQAFYKTIKRALLMFDELKEMVLDVEVAVNNRPLSYVKGDVEFPVLTSATMIYSQSNLLRRKMQMQLRMWTYLRERDMFVGARTFCGHTGPRNT